VERNVRRTVLLLVIALTLGVGLLAPGTLPADPFVRGDVDTNSSLDMADAVRLFGYLFRGSPRSLSCADAADANDIGEVDISDGIYILNYLFAGGPEPPPPFRVCGSDPTEDAVDCRVYRPCLGPFCEKTSFRSAYVDAGGHSLWTEAQGQGCPGIVLDSGPGDDRRSWDPVVNGVSRIGRSLRYDRAGLGGIKEFLLVPPGPLPDVPIAVLTGLNSDLGELFSSEVEAALGLLWDEAHEELAAP